MGSVLAELSLDFRPTFVPKTIRDFLKEVSMIRNVPERVAKFDDFLKRLEEEMRKIDAFKRELPLCMLLLNDAILTLKEELTQCAVPNAEPVLEEFIPLKKDCDENEEQNNDNKEKDCKDKKNWMSSVQLWNTDDYPTTDFKIDPKLTSKTEIKRNEKEYGFTTEDPVHCSRNRTGGRSFIPFKAYSAFPGIRKEDKDELPVHGLSLLTPGVKNPKEESGSSGSRSTSSRAVSSSAAAAAAVNVQSNLRAGQQQPQQQTSRKQRRCWSPELHRRFVSALQQLGGSQVATPKQIRELMQVDGLTNDEVKSHLQKYRLHTRRLPASSAAPANQSIVVLSGLWMSQDQYGDSSKASSSQSGSPQGPLQLTGTGGTSTTGCDSMEDDEDARSEGYSWKSHVHKPGNDDV
ncbi:transcription factor HHO6 [Ziziphus jujuba]|uniref:Transcription factor HHO6 n=1 Tax=Ziziphus jujuba TaxID=326968 RepID=A0A6P3ZAF7_ZIZJJ|nr:transcription factor HHO6 [Ziziphus jujuba]